MDLNRLVGVGANLKCVDAIQMVAAGAIKNVRAVPLGVLADAINFRLQLLELEIEEATVFFIVRVARGLHGQFTHALEHVCDLLGRAFRRLDQRDAVVGVADGLVEAADL